MQRGLLLAIKENYECWHAIKASNSFKYGVEVRRRRKAEAKVAKCTHCKWCHIKMVLIYATLR